MSETPVGEAVVLFVVGVWAICGTCRLVRGLDQATPCGAEKLKLIGCDASLRD